MGLCIVEAMGQIVRKCSEWDKVIGARSGNRNRMADGRGILSHPSTFTIVHLHLFKQGVLHDLQEFPALPARRAKLEMK